jgi:hypothetical protein
METKARERRLRELFELLLFLISATLRNKTNEFLRFLG